MPNRRVFLSGLAAGLGLPRATWADLGRPRVLSGAQTPDGQNLLVGLNAGGAIAFRIPLPARGHAAAAHPDLAEAVAFARRPGRFALVIDCQSGEVLHRLDAPQGTHFYGHGTYSEDGRYLFTTENRIDSGAGQIGVWDRTAGFARAGAFASHGIGPHDLLRLPGTTRLAVANGGIRTHPDSGREKLNLDTMRPNLTILDESGTLLHQAQVPLAMHQNSLRHLAAASDGTIACAFQWQGDLFDTPPLMATYQMQTGLTFPDMPDTAIHALNGYVGSVRFFGRDRIAISSPRGGVVQTYDRAGTLLSQTRAADICGLADLGGGAGLSSSGTGTLRRHQDRASQPLAHHPLAFDNHLVEI